ncbi:MAG: hypothetical protein U0797_13935 [Gemmataceae bacterium]
MTRLACFGLTLAAALGGLAAPAHARQGAGDPFRLVVVNRPAPYWGYVRYPLDAVANYTRAAGQYMIMRQEAIKMREENLRERLKTREAEFQHGWRMYEAYLEKNEWRYERQRQQEIKHARENASVAEKVSGNVLNYLLAELQKDSLSPEISQKVDPRWLKSINFMSTTGGNSYFLRTKPIPWTAVLQEDAFDTTRALIEEDLEKARNELMANKVPGKTLKSLIQHQDSLREGVARINQSRNTVWRPTDIIEATRQVFDLGQTIKLLRNPDEAKRLLAPPPDNVRTVAELVNHMREYALTFSAASTSGAQDYVSLHTAMAAEARAQLKRKAADK